MSRFFIDRPIFANVIAIVTMIFGVVALIGLPIEQYPEITPPTVQVSTFYPGASARVVSDTVASPIEQGVNGVENMMYMQSTSSSAGSYNLTITFEIGTNLDTAQVLVQNRIAQVEALLPEEARRQGMTVKKQSTNIIQVINLTSPEGKFDSLYMTNYATLKIRDPLSRIFGVGDVRAFGASEYSMRIWLDPERLKARRLTTRDVLAVLREQNVQVAAGAVGQSPSPVEQDFQFTIVALGRLSEPEEFEQIVVRGGDAGEGTRVVYLRDVARIELGGQTYDQAAFKNGEPAASLAIFQLPGANALQVADQVSAMMVRLEKDFPEGLTYDIPFDTTKFVRESITEVYKTLFEAGILVLIVILVFLQDWRGVLIPATTVPVTIVGAFAAMAALGFTINMLTLFGLILAIGIVVDDAIVIVENAAHHIERGLAPREATIKAMGEVTGPIVGITLVLLAVFVPTAFLAGITGQLYRQFALTIAATALISAINAVTLKPAQAASYLRPSRGRKNAFFRAFNAVYDRVAGAYLWVVRGLVRAPLIVLTGFAGVVAGTFWFYSTLPTGFLPAEDQGYAIGVAQLPDGASLERTKKVVLKASEILKQTPGVENVFAIAGFSLLESTSASNAATIFVIFESYEERGGPGLWRKARDQVARWRGLEVKPPGPDKTLDTILNTARGRAATEIYDGMVLLFPPPSIRGLGMTGGFQLQLQDKGSGLDELQKMVMEITQQDAPAQSSLKAVTSTFRSGVPQLYADVDRVKVKTRNLDLGDVFGTMQAYLGSVYVNDFNKFGRTYQVRVQADQQFRSREEDIRQLEVRNRDGAMVPLGSVISIDKTFGPQVLNRYNLYPAAMIQGEAAPGSSSGDALNLMEQMLERKLPPNMGYEWTGMSYQEKAVGGESLFIFGMAVVFVYLVLAAQYESWVLPAAVILVVPLGLLGAATAVAVRGYDNNIYTQIGIVLIIALASKNAILIVEFARELRLGGKSIREAAVEAASLRFRPIIMTSFAFILGVWPLVTAEGAGSASRRALGTAVFGGMIAATILAVFVVPVFFVIFQWLGERRIFGRPAGAVPAVEHAAPVAGPHKAPGHEVDAEPDSAEVIGAGV